MQQYWDILGIQATRDTKSVKQAYARKLRITRPEDDADAYQSLREAFDWAINYGVQTEEMEIGDSNDSVAVGNFPEHGSEYESAYSASEDIDSDPFYIEGRKQANEETLSVEASYFETVERLIGELFVTDDEDRMVKTFQGWLSNDEIANLKVRELFSERAYNLALDVMNPEPYPYKLFEAMAIEFEWIDTLQSNNVQAADQYFLQLRLEAFPRYLTLRNYLSTKQFIDFIAVDYWLAKFLLGPLQISLFCFFGRLGIFNFFVRKKTKSFIQAETRGALPEINTPSYRWWNDFLSMPRLSGEHVICGSILGLTVSLWVMESGLGSAVWQFFLVWMGVGTALVWGLVLIHHWLSTSLSRGAHFYSLACFWYVLLCVLMAFMKTSGDSLVFTLFGLAFVYVGFKLIGFVMLFYAYIVTFLLFLSTMVPGIEWNPRWLLLPIFIASSSHVAFTLSLPIMPVSLAKAARKTGIPHIIVVTVMTFVIMIAINLSSKL